MEQKTFDMAKDCMVCGKEIGFRGFCSTMCHNEHYDILSIINKKVIEIKPIQKWRLTVLESGIITGIIFIKEKHHKEKI